MPNKMPITYTPDTREDYNILPIAYIDGLSLPLHDLIYKSS